MRLLVEHHIRLMGGILKVVGKVNLSTEELATMLISKEGLK